MKAEAPEPSENEKKMTGEIESLSKQVSELTEKNKELDVSSWEVPLIFEPYFSS